MIESFFYTGLLFKVTFLLYALAAITYLIGVLAKRKIFDTIPFVLFLLAFIGCTILIAYRWIDAGRPPFKTLYESLVFAAWTVSLVSLFMEYRFKIRLFGLLSAISVVAIMIYALTKRDIEVMALPPALQTWMFIPHVISYFLAYGAIFVGGLSAALYLAFPNGVVSHHVLGDSDRLDFSSTTYQIVKFGFLFLTAGLLLGAWWGQAAWSNYWGWDPKENWAFISWLIFAAYLHFRNMGTWSKKKLSWVVIIGVIAIVFTYLGMDLLPTAEDSLHVYSGN